MDLTQEDIDDFISIWKEEFGETIDHDYARLRASQLLELFLLLSKTPNAQKTQSVPESLADKDTRGLAFIQTMIASTGRSPSLREIMYEIGYASPRSAQLMVRRLARNGKIAYDDGVIEIKR